MKDIRLEPKLIGIIDLSTEVITYKDCVGRINFTNGVGKTKIYVYSGEGTIPHFHIISNDGFECCICIYEALYFNHGSKQSRLNSKQRKILDDWMGDPSLTNSKLTNWEAIDFAWRIGNGDNYVSKNKKKPDYSNMINMRN